MLTIMARARTAEPDAVADEMAATIRRHLDTAKRTAERARGAQGGDRGRGRDARADEHPRRRGGPAPARADRVPAGPASTLQAYVREHLPARDPRRAQLEAIVRSAARSGLEQPQRGAIVAAAREANAEARREVTRVRSFRNVLLVTFAILAVAAIGVAVLGIVAARRGAAVLPARRQGRLPDRGDDRRRVTSTSAIAATVEPVGPGARGAGRPARRGRGGRVRRCAGSGARRLPYGLPVALALLKLPTGALTAVLGLLLMRGQFVPG